MKKWIILLFCLTLLPSITSARMQEEETAIVEVGGEESAEAVPHTPETQQKMQQAMMKLMPKLLPLIPEASTRESMNLGGFITMQDEECRHYAGISTEQMEQLQKSMQGMELRFAADIIPTAFKATQTDDPQELEKIAKNLVKKVTGIADDVYAKTQKIFTPGQIAKMKELRLMHSSLNSDMATVIFDFGQYDTLDLTDEQRKKLTAIREEYTKEYTAIVNKLADMLQKYVKDGQEPPEDVQEKAELLVEQLKQLAVRTKAKVLAILTKEQADRMEQLLAKAPKFFDQFRKDKNQEDDESWKKSWKPGDPVPEGATPPKPRGIFPIGR